MNQSVRILFTFFLAVFLFSCSYQKPGYNDYFIQEEGRAIRKKTDAYTAAHITKDTAYLNGIFTEDARILGPHADVVTGKKAIARLNEDWVNYNIYEFEAVSTATYGGGNFIVDEGNYYMVYGPDKTIDNGKYINVWKRIRGNWKLYSNIWNTSLPVDDTSYTVDQK